jgi:putative hydrolase of the HAD superfamily
MPTQDPIELVVFDMDGVLAHLDRARRLAILSRFTARSPEFIHQAIYASDFEPSAEAGSYVPGAAYLAEVNRRIGAALTREQWIAARRDAMTVIPKTLAVARQLQTRVEIATLTNNGSLLKEAIAEILPDVAEVFGATFHASFEFGARKPDPLVFYRLARHFDRLPRRILFIDDSPGYLVGARSAGLQTILFDQPAELPRQLTAFGLGLG